LLPEPPCLAHFSKRQLIQYSILPPAIKEKDLPNPGFLLFLFKKDHPSQSSPSYEGVYPGIAQLGNRNFLSEKIF
jgi:hypothetical protein